MVLLTAGAALVPFAYSRLRVPSSIVEIIYGMLLINLFLDHRPEWFGFFKELGLIYLMFIAGMELDFRKLITQGRFYLYLAVVALPFLMLPLAMAYMGLPLYLGIVVSVSSAGVLIPVLRELGISRTDISREIVNLALTGEIVSIAVLAGLDIYHKHGLALDALWAVARIALLFTGAAMFLWMLYLIAWWNPERVEKVMESEDPVEEGVRGIIFVVLLGALLAFHAGVEPILGSFIAGVIFSDVFRKKGRFEEKLNAVGFGFFIPIFFIGVGADFDLGLFRSLRDVGFALLLSLCVFAGNLFVLAIPLFIRMNVRDAWESCFLLSSPLSMMIVAATLGLKAGMLRPEHFGPVVLASMISTVMYPSIFRLMIKGRSGGGEGEDDSKISAP